MERKFTSAQLSRAPAAWTPGGIARMVRIPDEAPSPGFTETLCPVVESDSFLEVVILPDGSRLALRR